MRRRNSDNQQLARIIHTLFSLARALRRKEIQTIISQLITSKKIYICNDRIQELPVAAGGKNRNEYLCELSARCGKIS
jgi:hypothetical protein